MFQNQTRNFRRRRAGPRWGVSILWLALFLLAAPVLAHPLSQGSLDVSIGPDRVTVRARVTAEEAFVTNSSTGENPVPLPFAEKNEAAFARHAEYFALHLHVAADGRPLTAHIAKVTAPDDPSAASAFAVYELEYPFPAPPPQGIELHQDVLADGRFAPGAAWDATYVVNIQQVGKRGVGGLLLARGGSIAFPCDWSPAGAAGGDQPASVNKGRLFKEYFIEGVHHILTGWDHLLFVSALVLGAVSLWDLVKVVSAFTLAHTITLTLAALSIVHVPETISEPLISASIVFVALQNVFWPRTSRGALRLAAAFFFGLFHGLGFAGGLLEAMHGMHGKTVLLAILAFSLGVEAGHQMVVLPLFVGLKIARQSRPSELAREKLTFAFQRFGSAAISLAGLFYLVMALKLSFRG